MTMNAAGILRPEILQIQGRRYRKMPFTLKDAKMSSKDLASVSMDLVEEDCGYFEEADACAAELVDVEKTDSGYCVRLADVPSFFFGHIVGKEAKKRRELEKQTKTSIYVPKISEGGPIVISGRDRGAVLSAKTRIQLLVEDARKSAPGTHFLSIPLQSGEVSAQFTAFKESVLHTCPEARGLDESIFQLPPRLHLTLALLTLHSDKEVAEIVSLLSDNVGRLLKKHGGKQPFRIHLSGIEYMNDDPGEVDVLYAKVHPSDSSTRFQGFVEELVRCLEPSGFLKREQRDGIKLHATIMNSVFRESRDEENCYVSAKRSLGGRKTDPVKRPRLSFDARTILQAFEGFDFGEVEAESLHLSQRGQYGPTGYYLETARFDLRPPN